MDNLAGWDAVTDSLYIWHYNTIFANYLLPQPDLDEIAADIPLYKRSGVKGIFMQGTYTAMQDNRSTGGGGFMDDLKQYLIAKLLWNTRADVKAIRADFLNGFYGKAAGPIDGISICCMTRSARITSTALSLTVPRRRQA
jgi:hypothetical protein